MTETIPLVQSATAISQIINIEVEWNSGKWHFSKEREVKLENSICGFRRSLEMEGSFYEIREGSLAVNLAEVLLFPEEVVVFTSALKQPNYLFPPTYSEHLTVGDGICCLQLESLEPIEHFMGRLLEAFRLLDHHVPVILKTSM